MGIFKSLESIPNGIDSTPTGVNFSTVEYTYDSFLQKIVDGSFADNQIQSKIVRSYDTYTNYDNFKDPSTRSIFQELWTNTRFLKNFESVLKSGTIKLDSFNIRTVNKIAYDYYCEKVNSTDEKEKEIVNLLLSICGILNQNIIIQFCSIMDYNSALFLSIARRSSFKPEECVHRLNQFIIRLGYNFSVKNIIFIYSKTYDDEFATLFVHSMTGQDSICIYEDADSKERYDLISYALALILESMTTVEMTKVLKRYASYLSLLDNKKVRFSLNSLSDDFPRLLTTLRTLKDEEGIIIP